MAPRGAPFAAADEVEEEETKTRGLQVSSCACADCCNGVTPRSQVRSPSDLYVRSLHAEHLALPASDGDDYYATERGSEEDEEESIEDIAKSAELEDRIRRERDVELDRWQVLADSLEGEDLRPRSREEPEPSPPDRTPEAAAEEEGAGQRHHTPASASSEDGDARGEVPRLESALLFALGKARQEVRESRESGRPLAKQEKAWIRLARLKRLQEAWIRLVGRGANGPPESPREGPQVAAINGSWEVATFAG